jgi:hypothetical protein
MPHSGELSSLGIQLFHYGTEMAPGEDKETVRRNKELGRGAMQQGRKMPEDVD